MSRWARRTHKGTGRRCWEVSMLPCEKSLTPLRGGRGREQEAQSASRSRKWQGHGCPPRGSRRNQSRQHPDCSQQDRAGCLSYTAVRRETCCLKPPILWTFVTAATGHKNTDRNRNQVTEDVSCPPSARGGRTWDGHLRTPWFEDAGKTA